MAERKAAGFNIPLNFYDGPEVQSIPKRIRAAAIGVWALAGDYAATQLTDGYVSAETLRSFGCTPPIRAALMVTVNIKGELSPLWIDGRDDGGILLTNWSKHQRTNEEVSTYREAEAERKRVARAAKKKAAENKSRPTLDQLSTNSHATVDQLSHVDSDSTVDDGNPHTSGKRKTSGRTPAGRPGNVRSTKTETEVMWR